MAIAFDKAGSAATSSSTTATVALAAAAANSVAVIFLTYNNTDQGPFVSMQVNGVGATIIGSEYQLPVATVIRLRAYYFPNPPTTSVNYTLTLTNVESGANILVAIYSGAAQTQPDSSSGGAELATPFTNSTTVVAENCWTVGWGRRYGGSTISVDSGTERVERDDGLSIADSNGTVATGSNSLSWASDAATVHSWMISLAPAVAAGPANLKTYNTNTKANIKSMNTNLIANVKTFDTNA